MWIVALWDRRAKFNLTDGDVTIQIHLDTLDFLDRTQSHPSKKETNIYITHTGLGITPDNASLFEL